MGSILPRLLRPVHRQTAGPHRRTQRLYPSVFRSLLGSAGCGSGGRRPHRGDPGSGGHPVGRQCGQRSDQHHHQECRRNPGKLGRSRQRHKRIRLCNRPLWRQAGREWLLSSIRQILHPGSLKRIGPSRRGRLAPRPRRHQNGLATFTPWEPDPGGERLRRTSGPEFYAGHFPVSPLRADGLLRRRVERWRSSRPLEAPPGRSRISGTTALLGSPGSQRRHRPGSDPKRRHRFPAPL